MTTNSRAALSNQDASTLHIYSTSEPQEKDNNWIQPSISQQAVDLSHSSLIDGIYVQTNQQVMLKIEISDIETELVAMASDPDVQRELNLISDEFAGTEMDGLNDVV